MRNRGYKKTVCLMCAGTAAFMLFISNVSAFESCEHYDLSQLSLEFAKQYMDSEYFLSDEKLSRAQRDRMAEAASIVLDLIGENRIEDAVICKVNTRVTDRGFSYGQVIEIVDFVYSPDLLFQASGQMSKLPSSVSELNKDVFRHSAQLTQEYLRASTNNESHFQDAMISNFRYWHSRAVSQAATAGGLFIALAYNAVADHFLQDFFAPGHIITPRQDFPDVVAVSWHDLHNREGQRLLVHPWDKFVGFQKIAEKTDSSFANALISVGTGKLKTSKHGVAERIQRCFWSFGESHQIRLHGDGYFRRAPESDNAICQKLIMIFAQSASILDVIESYIVQNSRNEYQEFVWCAQMKESLAAQKARLEDADISPRTPGQTKFGCTELFAEDHRMTDSKFMLKPFKFSLPRARIGPFEYQIENRLNAGETVSNDVFKSFETVLGANIANESTINDDAASRRTITIESLVFGWPGSPNYIRNENYEPRLPGWIRNVGLIVGWTESIGEGPELQGPSIRVSKQFEKLTLQIGVYGRKLLYSDNNVRLWGNSYGVRIEGGFSSLTFFGSFGRDNFIGPLDTLESDWMVSGGIQLAFTPGLVRKIFNR